VKFTVTLMVFIFFMTACKSPILNHVKKLKEAGTESVGEIVPIEGLLIEKLGLRLNWRWIKGPSGLVSVENEMEIEILDLEGNRTDLPVEYQIFTYGWMPSMGHGTADDGYIEEAGNGVFLWKELFFNMGGTWTLYFLFYKNGELIENLEYSVTLNEEAA